MKNRQDKNLALAQIIVCQHFWGYCGVDWGIKDNVLHYLAQHKNNSIGLVGDIGRKSQLQNALERILTIN